MTTAPATVPSTTPQAADFERIVAEIMNGRTPLPNAEELPLPRGVAMIASSNLQQIDGTHSARLADNRWLGSARYFLQCTPYGRFSGSGFVMTHGQDGAGKVIRFAICEHSIVTGTDANPRRGWHPARCDRCGTDFSVDSGG